MSDTKNYEIMEITQMMSDNNRIKGDVSQAAEMVRSMFNEKYIAPITRAINTENKRAKNHPVREARLLKALKPFVDAGRHPGIDRAMDALHMAETLRGLKSTMPLPHTPRTPAPTSAPVRTAEAAAAFHGYGYDTSIHPDGVYDVDYDCLEGSAPRNIEPPANLLPIFFAMAMMRR